MRISLLLALVFILLLFTGLGVFRLYFDFDWNTGTNDGQLFSLKIRGGKSFDLFGSDGLGSSFWLIQGGVLLLAVVMPLFRPVGAALLALLTAVGIFFMHMQPGEVGLGGLQNAAVPIEFQFLTILVLLALYTLLAYHTELRDRRKFTTLMSQYVSPELAAEYSRDPERMGLEGEQREVSVLFCDVVGFSALSEEMDSPAVAKWLNSYFSHVSKIVVRHAGTIDKYMGDSVMAFWGAPALSDTHAHDALSAALDIQQELSELNQLYCNQGLPEISVAIGVSTGLANAGNLGSEYRMAYTVVGDTVNVAQRVEEQTRLYGVPIAVAGETATVLPDMLFRELDTVNIRGRSKPIRMFQPLGKISEVDNETRQLARDHQSAMRASKAGHWQEASDLFTRLRDEWGPSGMYNLYLRGIEQASGGAVKAAIPDNAHGTPANSANLSTRAAAKPGNVMKGRNGSQVARTGASGEADVRGGAAGDSSSQGIDLPRSRVS